VKHIIVLHVFVFTLSENSGYFLFIFDLKLILRVFLAVGTDNIYIVCVTLGA